MAMPFYGCFAREAIETHSEATMKLKPHLIEIAGVGLLVALTSADALAQRSNVPGATGPSAGPWTANNVTAARPFGSIDVSRAGSSAESVRTWSQGRSGTERAELTGRCEVITTPANAGRYRAGDLQFCRNYMMVGSARSISPGPNR
jgi:hypothetical protein